MNDARLTTEQRLAGLERENRVLLDKLKILHRMLREQRLLINEFITRELALTDANDRDDSGRPEKALYTFVCQQRFERLEAAIDNMRRLKGNSGIGRKAV